MVRGLGVNSSFKCYLSVGHTFNPVTYALTSRTSSNAQSIQAVSNILDLVLLLKTGFSADDNFARATTKFVECFFTQRHDLFVLSKGRAYGSWRYFVALDMQPTWPVIFRSVTTIDSSRSYREFVWKVSSIITTSPYSQKFATICGVGKLIPTISPSLPTNIRLRPLSSSCLRTSSVNAAFDGMRRDFMRRTSESVTEMPSGPIKYVLEKHFALPPRASAIAKFEFPALANCWTICRSCPESVY